MVIRQPPTLEHQATHIHSQIHTLQHVPLAAAAIVSPEVLLFCGRLDLRFRSIPAWKGRKAQLCGMALTSRVFQITPIGPVADESPDGVVGQAHPHPKARTPQGQVP